MSYDNEDLVKIIQAAEKALAELNLELGPPGHGATFHVDHRSEEELAGGKRQHALQLLILWDGTLPPALQPDPNAVAGDDFELSPEDRAFFDSLAGDLPLVDDETAWDAEKAVQDANQSTIVEEFLKLRKENGS